MPCRARAAAASVDLPRRRALVWAGGALLAVAGAALASRKAAAMTLVEADAQTQALLHSACGQVAYHNQLIADARAALEGSGKVGPRAELAALDCPICGCRLQLDDKKTDPPR
jgi:hypothetical protein